MNKNSNILTIAPMNINTAPIAIVPKHIIALLNAVQKAPLGPSKSFTPSC